MRKADTRIDEMAMRIEFVAWHSTRPLSDAEVSGRLATVEGFYPHDGYDFHVLAGHAGHTGLALWFPKIKGLSQIAGPTAGALALASHPPFGISEHVPVVGKCGPADVLSLHEKVRRNPELVRDLATPLTLAHLAADGGLHIHNDVRGFAELYRHRHPDGIQVWSNRLAMPLLFAGSAPVESVEAAQLRAVYSYYPFEHTPFANVERVLGGGSVFAGDWPGAPVVNRLNLLVEMLGDAYSRQGEPVDYDACRAAVTRMVGEVNLFWTGKLRCGLTGGRDSRSVLAFLLAGGMAERVELSTIKILKQDYEVAEQLVAACHARGFKVDWKLVERRKSNYSARNNEAAWAAFPAAKSHQRGALASVARWWQRQPRSSGATDYVYHANPLLDRMTFQFHRMDGQTMPAGYYQSPVRDSPHDDMPLLFGGQSGEVLRASQYTEEHLAGGPDDRAWKLARARYRLGKAKRPPMDPKRPYPRAVHDLANATWERYLTEAKAGGIGGFLVFDYLNVAAQQSRRVDVPKQLRLVCPLSHPLLLRESYKLSERERIASAMPMGLIGSLAPFLMRIPFSHQIPIETTEVRLDMTGKPQFWDADAVPGFLAILDDTQAWGDAFHVPSIRQEFGGEVAPELNAYQRDTIGGLMCWRTAQRSYCAVLAAYIARQVQVRSDIYRAA